jgi:hypothetical protein
MSSRQLSALWLDTSVQQVEEPAKVVNERTKKIKDIPQPLFTKLFDKGFQLKSDLLSTDHASGSLPETIHHSSQQLFVPGSPVALGPLTGQGVVILAIKDSLDLFESVVLVPDHLFGIARPVAPFFRTTADDNVDILYRRALFIGLSPYS